MTVFKREFQKNFKGLLIWTLSVAGLLTLMLGQFQAMGSSVDTGAYTEQFKTAMGLDKVDMNTFLGYYAIKASIMVTLFGGIYAAMLGSALLIKDESLLSRPIARGRIVLERVLAVTINILIFNVAIAVVILSAESDGRIFPIILGQFLLHMIFVCISFLIAALKIRSKAALFLPIGIVLATYAISLVYGLSEKLEYFKYLSPFYYTDAKDVIVNGSMSNGNLVVMLMVLLLSAVSGYLVYTKRDMPA